MLPFVFAIVAGAVAFLLASVTRNQGWYLADQVCSQGGALCDNPKLIFIAVGAVAVIVTIRAVVKT
ncbi:MAG: hypothetical protein V4661_00055 [Pseudomonadota bacterium]